VTLLSDPIFKTGSLLRSCDCGCQRQFVPPSSAPHKRFATESCRMKWHRRRWREAARLLTAAEALDSALPTPATHDEEEAFGYSDDSPEE
jgi:hypothetical protein